MTPSMVPSQTVLVHTDFWGKFLLLKELRQHLRKFSFGFLKKPRQFWWKLTHFWHASKPSAATHSSASFPPPFLARDWLKSLWRPPWNELAHALFRSMTYRAFHMKSCRHQTKSLSTSVAAIDSYDYFLTTRIVEHIQFNARFSVYQYFTSFRAWNRNTSLWRRTYVRTLQEHVPPESE